MKGKSHGYGTGDIGAAGCFWCVEAVFNQLKGVESAISGYMGGHVENPTYEQVCGKRTGHAEVVNVTFDNAVISFEEALNIFFATHDPTTLNRQGHDIGPAVSLGNLASYATAEAHRGRDHQAAGRGPASSATRS